MSVTQRRYSGPADRQAMVNLVRAFPDDHVHGLDLPYRLCSWALDDPDNVGLWVDAEGQLLAWAVMQTPFWTIDIALHPDSDASLYRQLLAWAERRAVALLETPGGHPMWFVMAFADQAARVADLEQAGFASQADVGQDSWSQVLMLRPAHTPVAPVALPPGFALEPLGGEGRVPAYVELHRTVFESKSMTLEWRTRTLHCLEYQPGLDWVAVAPDGRLAAFCIGWLDRALPEPGGQIEPMGVHPDFRALGLGRAVLSKVVQRLLDHGARRIYVETDRYRNAALGLYESLGFRAMRDILVYRKDYSSPRAS